MSHGINGGSVDSNYSSLSAIRAGGAIFLTGQLHYVYSQANNRYTVPVSINLQAQLADDEEIYTQSATFQCDTLNNTSTTYISTPNVMCCLDINNQTGNGTLYASSSAVGTFVHRFTKVLFIRKKR